MKIINKKSDQETEICCCPFFCCSQHTDFAKSPSAYRRVEVKNKDKLPTIVIVKNTDPSII